MIEVIMTFSGIFVDKPVKKTLHIEEETIALERKNEYSGRFEAVTVGQLFDLWRKESDYVQYNIEPESQLTADYFPHWFYMKYFAGKAAASTILNLEFKKI